MNLFSELLDTQSKLQDSAIIRIYRLLLFPEVFSDNQFDLITCNLELLTAARGNKVFKKRVHLFHIYR